MTSRLRRSDWKQASALVPLAVLSGGWTVLMAVSSAGASPSVTSAVPATPPVAPIEAPASLSRELGAAPAIRRAATSTGGSGIPAAALAAYQRAAQVMSTTDPECNLAWPLLAAIGRVESDHGRYDGSVLSPEGVAQPAIIGVPLNGAHGTARIIDSDAGTYDGDVTFDRAVGPMQFIPSTWALAGVDGDGDQQRNPQDIDDAALAAAVYLCSGPDDLSTENGVTTAVYRYNHSSDYVALVKTAADRYAEGSWSTVPTATYSTVTLAPHTGAPVDLQRRRDRDDRLAKPPAEPSPGTPKQPTPKPASEEKPSPVGEEPAKKGLDETVAQLPEVLEGVVTEVVRGLDSVVGGLLKP